MAWIVLESFYLRFWHHLLLMLYDRLLMETVMASFTETLVLLYISLITVNYQLSFLPFSFDLVCRYCMWYVVVVFVLQRLHTEIGSRTIICKNCIIETQTENVRNCEHKHTKLTYRIRKQEVCLCRPFLSNRAGCSKVYHSKT